MILIWITLVCVSLLYAGLIIILQVGLNSLQAFVVPDDTAAIKLTVIVPFRNEENEIEGLVSALTGQDYPQESYELLFINDHSDDRSKVLLKEATGTVKNARILDLTTGTGKKAALAEALGQAHNRHIIITDADCRPVKTWLSSMAGFFRNTSAKMLIGPVLYSDTRSIPGRMQSLEYLSLTGVTAGAAGLGNPILASGANLMFERDSFLEFLKEADPPASSGEDLFFLIWLKRRYPGKVYYLLSEEAAVFTRPGRGLNDLIAQRLRWASKSRFYRDAFLITASLIVYLFNLLLLVLLIAGVFVPGLLYGFFLMFAAKCFIDLIFLTDVCTRFNQRKLLKVFVPVQVLYPFYIVFTGTFGHILPYIWKGRRKGTSQGHG